MLGHAEEALTAGNSALSRAESLEHPFSMALSLDYLAMLYLFLDEPGHAIERVDRAAAICTEYGFRYYLTWASVIRGWYLCTSGKFEKGIEEIRAATAAFAEMCAGLRQSYYQTLLAQACEQAGRIPEALTAISGALETLDKTGETWFEAETHRVRGTIFLQLRDLAGAEASFERALAVARQLGAKTFELRAAQCLEKISAGKGEPGRSETALLGSGYKPAKISCEPESRDPNSIGLKISRRTLQSG